MTLTRYEFILAAAAMLLAVPWLVAREKTKRELARRFASERLRSRPPAARGMRPYVIGIAAALFALAAAGPRAGFTTRPRLLSAEMTVIAIDSSESMRVQDLGIPRLQFAKSLAITSLEEAGSRVGLVAFEGVAEVLSPLTIDGAALTTMIETVAPGELPEAGSNLESAIHASLDLLASSNGRKRILLIGDGEETEGDWRRASLRAERENVAIDTVVIGSASGGEIATESGAPLRDERGEIVVSRSHPETFRAIAKMTGGRFLENPSSPIRTAGATGRTEDAPGVERVPIERYQWPLAAGLLLLAIGSLANRGAE
jgi:Ca-activated chloride channel homolog